MTTSLLVVAIRVSSMTFWESSFNRVVEKMAKIKKVYVDLFFQKCRDDEIVVWYNWDRGIAWKDRSQGRKGESRQGTEMGAQRGRDYSHWARRG